MPERLKQILSHKAWLAAALCSAAVILFLVAALDARYQAALEAQNREIAAENRKTRENVSQLAAALERAKAEEHRRIETGFGDANLFEGVQVQIEGVSILGKSFSRASDHGIAATYGGEVFHDTDNLILDPDRPNRGYPNLRIQVLQPRPFTDRSFFERLFDKHFYGSAFLEKTFRRSSKVDAFHWRTDDAVMLVEQHALQFAVDVNTQYNQKSDDAGPSVTAAADVFGRPLDNGWEWDNKRYPPVHIVLSFIPKSPRYLTDDSFASPVFAVAAVELIGIKPYAAAAASENRMGADADLVIGKTLPLYREMADLPVTISARERARYDADTQRLIEAFTAVKGKSREEILNRDIFGKKKYGVVRIANIGTVSEGNIFVGTTRASEAYRFIFALHLFVYGDWKTRYQPIAQEWGAIEDKALIQRKRSLIDRALSGLLDTFIPTLGLGRVGQFVLIALAAILVLPFLPALVQIVGLGLSMVTAVVKFLKKPLG